MKRAPLRYCCLLLLSLSALAQSTGHSVTVTWNASTTTGGTIAYNVYRSTTSGTGYSQVNTSPIVGLSFNDTQVANGTTYFYVVTTLQTLNGVTTESANSNQASAVIPSAPAPPTGVSASVK